MIDRAARFRELHEDGCFVLPNPWDPGSAVALASLGFRALATSSAALGFALARQDSPRAIEAKDALSNIETIVSATSLPVNADFQNGYGRSADEVFTNVRRCIETGVAGLSIEDATGDASQPLFSMDDALDRVRAARAAVVESGSDIVLTARCEAFLVGIDRPLEVALERLVAFAEAGADCLFAPDLRTSQDISAVVAAVAPKPVNVLAADPEWMTTRTLADLGVRRISVGSALARVMWKQFLIAAREIAESGSFSGLANSEPFDALNAMFGEHHQS